MVSASRTASASCFIMRLSNLHVQHSHGAGGVFLLMIEEASEDGLHCGHIPQGVQQLVSRGKLTCLTHNSHPDPVYREMNSGRGCLKSRYASSLSMVPPV